MKTLSKSHFNRFLLALFTAVYALSLTACTNQPEMEIKKVPLENTGSNTAQISPSSTENVASRRTPASKPLLLPQNKYEFPLEFSYPLNLNLEISSSQFTVGEELFLGQKFVYDGSFGIFSPGLNSELKASVSKELSCDVLVKSHPGKYLPIIFDKPHLCKVIMVNDTPIVYAIGFGVAYEVVLHLSAMVLILDEKEGIVLQGLSQKLKSAKYQATIDSYGKKYPNMDFPDENWKTLADTLAKIMAEEIQNPSQELKDNWKFLEEFSKGIKIKSSTER